MPISEIGHKCLIELTQLALKLSGLLFPTFQYVLIAFLQHHLVILLQYSDKFMHNKAKFCIISLHSTLLCFCDVLLCEANTIQCHTYLFRSIKHEFCLTNFRKNINVSQKLISLLKGNSKWGKICKGCTNPDHPFNKWNFSGFL